MIKYLSKKSSLSFYRWWSLSRPTQYTSHKGMFLWYRVFKFLYGYDHLMFYSLCRDDDFLKIFFFIIWATSSSMHAVSDDVLLIEAWLIMEGPSPYVQCTVLPNNREGMTQFFFTESADNFWTNSVQKYSTMFVKY